MATTTAAQSRTPPLSLSPACSSETSPVSPAMKASGQSMGSDNGGNNLQFLSFLDLTSLATTPASSAPSISPSATTALNKTKVPGLTLAGGSYKPASGRGKKAAVPKVPGDLDDFDNNDDGADAEVLLKRQGNSLAARKYRQKKLDRISELEVEVGQLQEERDTLRIQLARQEAETAALREMLLMRDRDDGGNAKRRKRK